MNKILQITERDVLIAVDVQYDFCPGGRLSVPRGDEVIRPINEIARHFQHVIITQDWHPPGHLSFASSHGYRPPAPEVIASPTVKAVAPMQTLN